MAASPEPTKQTPTPSSPLAVASLAIALYIAVIDAAVETFRGGSPARWWVVGAVVAYLAISVGLWRYRPSEWQRMGWSGRASASFFLLLGLLAFTVWLPGGLTDGLRVAGQPTSRVLSLFTAVVIVLAGLSLVRLSWLPRWAKIVAGLLAAYGLAAFVTGIVTGAEYAALLHGDSLWTRLPARLQGAFVGALVVVPAGLLLRAAHMLKAAPGVSRAWDLRQGLAMAMSLLMAVSAFTSSGAIGPEPSAAEIVQPVTKSYQELGEAMAGPKPTTPLTPDQTADKLGKLFPQLEQAERQIPRDTFDLQAVIDKVGKDPQKLFEWVRDNTYFVPYRGLLRGDKGVLMDRLGNSLDRAMLLYAMLRNVGQPVRLAHGTLTEGQAQDVLGKVRPFPSFEEYTSSASSAAATDAFVKQYADQNHVDAAKIRKALDQLTAQQQRVKELVQKRVAAQAAMISAAVGHPPASALAEERADQVRSVTDHWWVQWQNGPNWIDLDPTLPDAQPGETLTAVQATPAPGSYTDLGEDLLHTVQIRVVIEVWKHGSVTEVPVLTQELLPADLIGQSIVLRQIPVRWPQDLNMFQEKDPIEKFKQTVLAQTEWLPVLSVGSRNISRYSFNDYGDLTDSTMPGYMQNVMSGRVLAHKEEEAVAVLGNNIKGLLSGPRGPQQTPDRKPAAEPERTQVTAEWIDYEIRTPGQPGRKIRRQISDLLTTTRRRERDYSSWRMNDQLLMERAAELLTQTEILPLVCQLSPEFVSELTAGNLISDRRPLLGILSQNNSDLASVLMQASQLKPLPGALYSFALARRAWSRGEFYLNSTNVVTIHESIRIDAHGDIARLHGFDIVDNDVGTIAREARNPVPLRIEQGVLDTNAEAILTSDCREISNVLRCPDVENVAELTAGGLQRKITVRPDGAGRLQLVGLPKEIQSRVRSDLDAGNEVILPIGAHSGDASGIVSWWRVKPSTGQTLGVGNRGWGQVTVEYVVSAALIAGTVANLSLAACLLGRRRALGKYKKVAEAGDRYQEGCAIAYAGSFVATFWLLMNPADTMGLMWFNVTGAGISGALGGYTAGVMQ